MTELEELGRTLKTARRKKNLTQQQLADLSHMSLKYLQLVEKGGKNPSFEILRALSGVLDLSLDALINPTMENDEKAANEMKQLYLSCPPDVRIILLNSTRSLANELKNFASTHDSTVTAL